MSAIMPILVSLTVSITVLMTYYYYLKVLYSKIDIRHKLSDSFFKYWSIDKFAKDIVRLKRFKDLRNYIEDNYKWEICHFQKMNDDLEHIFYIKKNTVLSCPFPIKPDNYSNMQLSLFIAHILIEENLIFTEFYQNFVGYLNRRKH